MYRGVALLLSAFLLLADSAVAFVIQAPSGKASAQLSLFKGLGDAFKNDSTLGKAQNAGLSNGPNFNENVTVNGRPVPGAVVGQKLTVVAGKVRVKIPVNCQKGDCGTCMVKLNGKQVKACQTILPAAKASIETL